MTEPERESAMPAREWAQWLRELKEASGASYADIARSIDEEERLVKKWMPVTGEPVMPRGEALLKLLDFFGVTMTPPPPRSVAESLTGDLRMIRSEIGDLHREAGLSAAERQMLVAAIEARLTALETKLDAGQQKTAESLAKLSSAIDELSAQLRAEEPGSPRRKRAKP